MLRRTKTIAHHIHYLFDINKIAETTITTTKGQIAYQPHEVWLKWMILNCDWKIPPNCWHIVKMNKLVFVVHISKACHQFSVHAKRIICPYSVYWILEIQNNHRLRSILCGERATNCWCGMSINSFNGHNVITDQVNWGRQILFFFFLSVLRSKKKCIV